MTRHHKNYHTAAQKIIEHVGKDIVIGVPLGMGKPIGLLNAFYTIASEDPSISLTIVTGLTLARPPLKNELEKRFITPILDRVLKDFVDPLYEEARIKQRLPKNINVIEFFLTPGNYRSNHYVQQNYISSTYTNAIRDVLSFPINVHAQLVAHQHRDIEDYSLSCNTDLFHDMHKRLKEYELQGRKIATVAEVNENLPFMYGDAIVNEKIFSDIIDTGQYRQLFSIPREEITAQDHMIGLYTSCLVKDDSCLQFGIGKLSNAVASALVLRHQHNDIYHELLNELNIKEKFAELIHSTGATSPFTRGLYASTEMLSDEYIELWNKGILKKKVYDHIGLQTLLNANEINEKISPTLLTTLLKHHLIHSPLSEKDIKFLKKFGIFKTDILYQDKVLLLPSGEKITADLNNAESHMKIAETCLGSYLQNGKIIHAGFFVGSTELYSQLKKMSYDDLQKIEMTAISRTNALTWRPKLLKLQRQQTRFVNSALMLTLGGMVISDGLKDYQEISGVGGQFDFVNMAHQLPHARSIINCRSTRETTKGVVSNILWDYPNATLSRYLRDIVITEYGIADCRSKKDTDVITSILNITDSRFQNELLAEAKKSGKVPSHYQIPPAFKKNYPEKIEKFIQKARAKGQCLPYPFGSDLTKDEEILATALLSLKNNSKFQWVSLLFFSLLSFHKESAYDHYLERMGLKNPKTLKEYIYKKLLMHAISKNQSTVH